MITSLMYDYFYNLQDINNKLFIFLNHILNISFLPYILQLIGRPFFFTNFIIYYLLAVILFYRKLTNSLKKHNLNHFTNQFWYGYNRLIHSGIIYSIFIIVYASLKYSVNLPRPYCSLPKESYITILHTINERCLSSFPSAHAGLALLIAYFVWDAINSNLKIMSVIIVFMVGLSRISVALHYPADIFYGWLISIGTIFLGKIIFNLTKNNIIIFFGKIFYKYLKTKVNYNF